MKILLIDTPVMLVVSNKDFSCSSPFSLDDIQYLNSCYRSI